MTKFSQRTLGLHSAAAAGALLLATGMPPIAAPAMAESIETIAVDARPFPREFEQDDLRFWLHAPQFKSIRGDHVTGQATVSVQIGERKDAEGKAEPVLTHGMIWFGARAEIDKADRTATMHDIEVQRVSFPDQKDSEARFADSIQKVATDMIKSVSLDQLEAAIALGRTPASNHKGL